MRNYARILAYGRPWRWHALAALGFLGVYNLFSVASLALVIPFLQILFSESVSPPPPAGWSWLDVSALKDAAYYWLGQTMLAQGKPTVLVGFCVLLVVLILVKNLARFGSYYYLIPYEQGIVQVLRSRLFAKLQELPLHYFQRTRKGRLLNIAGSDLQTVQEGVVGVLFSLFSDPMTMLFFLLAMLLVSWQMTLFALLVLPLTGFLIARIIRSLKKRAHAGQHILDNLTAKLEEYMGGIRVVRAFTAEDRLRAQLEDYNTRYNERMRSLRYRLNAASPLTEVLSVLVVAGLILYGGMLILNQDSHLKPAEFIGFIALFAQFLAPVKVFIQTLARIQKAVVSHERIRVFFRESPAQTELADAAAPTSPPAPAAPQPKAEPLAFRERLQLRQVHFAYPAQENEPPYPVLHGIDLTLHKGETLALVGPSGAGKSTLMDLLCRFYDPTDGRILLDGQDYRQLPPQQLRQLFGLVTQQGVLFHDTVWNNLTLGKPQATEAEVVAAAQAAYIHHDLAALPQGYHTLLGESGARLSGGQRQRLTIARALLHDPQILLLDEATSALDSEAERLVQQALEQLLVGRTALVIAHRLSTIQRADRILVLDQGQIVQEGPHAELLAQQGLYKRLYELQFGG